MLDDLIEWFDREPPCKHDWTAAKPIILGSVRCCRVTGCKRMEQLMPHPRLPLVTKWVQVSQKIGCAIR